MPVINIGIQITAQNQATAGVRSVQNSLRGLERSAQGASRVMRTLQGVIVGALLYKTVELGRNFVSMAGDLQSLQIRLAGVTGSAEKADEVFASLTQRFKSAPFDIKEIAQGFSRIAATGLDLSKTDSLIGAVVDSVAAFGGGSQEMSRAFIGFAQVLGKGSLQMEELRQQIGEQIPSAMQIMANEADVSVAEFVMQVTNGMISGQRAVELFTNGAQKAFGGFASGLQFTIKGSMARVVSEFNIGLKNLMDNTTVDERIGIVFNNISDQVARFMASIDEGKIQRFFDTLSKMWETGSNFAEAMTKIASAVSSLASQLLDFVASLQGDTLEWGIIGYALFGKRGALILGFMGSLKGKIEEIGQSLEGGAFDNLLQFSAFGGDGMTAFERVQQRLTGSHVKENIETNLNNPFREHLVLIEAVKKSQEQLAERIDAVTAVEGLSMAGIGALQELSTLAESTGARAHGAMLPWLDDVDRINTSLDKLNIKLSADRARLAELQGQSERSPNDERNLASLQASLNDIGGLMGQVRANRDAFVSKGITDFRDNFTDVIDRTADSIEALGSRFNQDQFGAQIEQVNKQFNGFVESLSEANDKASLLHSTTQDEADALDRIGELENRANQYRIEAIDLINTRKQLYIEQVQIAERLERMQLDETKRQLQNSSNLDPRFNMLSGTEGGSLFEEATARRAELLQNIQQYTSNINQKVQELTGVTDPAQRASIQETIDKYKEMSQVTSEALGNLSAQGLAQQQLWVSIGQTIEQSIGSALEGVIMGTKTWADVGRQAFASLTTAAIQYLTKLIFIKAMETSMNMIAPGSGSLLSFLANANGNAFQGQITPFKNGGVLSGPTLFGLAGEAGEEAIMPLTRIGGKLGVQASGGGGPQYHITVQAVDTQTGMEFISKHIETIDGNLRHRHNLNRAMR